MDVGWNYKLEGDQTNNPVVMVENLGINDSNLGLIMGWVHFPTDADMLKVFKTDKFKPKAGRLKAWGRGRDKYNKIIQENDPHWIAVRNSTPLHIDPPYPRYSHQFKVRWDKGMRLRGLDKVEITLGRGFFYILDTHSPHQIINVGNDGGWNVALSFDSHKVWSLNAAMNLLTGYAAKSPFLP